MSKEADQRDAIFERLFGEEATEERREAERIEAEHVAALTDEMELLGMTRPQSAIEWYMLAKRVGADALGPRSDIAIQAIAWAEGQIEARKLRNVAADDGLSELTWTEELVLGQLDDGKWQTAKAITAGINRAGNNVHVGNARRALASLKKSGRVEHDRPAGVYRRRPTVARAKARAE